MLGVLPVGGGRRTLWAMCVVATHRALPTPSPKGRLGFAPYWMSRLIACAIKISVLCINVIY